MTRNDVLREAPTTVPDSHSVGSLLPSGSPAVAASATVFSVLNGDCTCETKSTVADSYSVGSPLPPANISMKWREAHTACRTLTVSAAPLPSGNARRVPPSRWAGRTITLPAAWAETFLTKTTYTNHQLLGGQLHLSAAQPPPANIQMKTRDAPTTVPDSCSVGGSLPSGSPAALRPGTAVRTAEILIENARLEFRVNHRKQTFAIKSNRERMALSSLQKSARGEATSRKRKASLTSEEVSYIEGRNLNGLRPSGLVAHRIRPGAK